MNELSNRSDWRVRAALAVVVSLLLAVGPWAQDAEEEEPPPPEAEGAIFALPRVMWRVQRTSGGSLGIKTSRRTGDLYVHEESLKFVDGRRRDEIALADIEMAYEGSLGQDVDTRWFVLKMRPGGKIRVVGIRDGKKLGFGGRTPEITERLLTHLEERGSAQFRSREGWRRFNEVGRQLSLAIPDAWAAETERLATDGSDVIGGRFRFGSRSAQQTTDLLLELWDAPIGANCDRINKRGRRGLLRELGERRGVDLGPDHVVPGTDLRLSHCRAVELRWNSGGRQHRARAAANGKTIYVLELRSAEGSDESARFDLLMDSVRMPLLP